MTKKKTIFDVDVNFQPFIKRCQENYTHELLEVTVRCFIVSVTVFFRPGVLLFHTEHGVMEQTVSLTHTYKIGKERVGEIDR